MCIQCLGHFSLLAPHILPYPLPLFPPVPALTPRYQGETILPYL
jgi:hypothetical protein